jgi:hypothetical protein
MKKKLLLNWLYYRPVGHAIESLKLTKAYALANKDLDVYLVLNIDTPIELAKACSWIKKVYPISLEEVKKNGAEAACLKKIPKKWDYIISDSRVKRFNSKWDDVNLIKAHTILSSLFIAKIAKGYTELNNPHDGGILPLVTNTKLTLPIPPKAKQFSKKYKHDGTKICIMLGGSVGMIQSPSLDMWLNICEALHKALPNLKIYFTGVSRSANNRTYTKGFTLDEVKFLTYKLANAESAYDIGLWNQIALIHSCDIFLSPHTGFGFISPLVGTPWLEIATCRWSAYIFNNISFYSILPKCNSYPSHRDWDKDCNRLLSQGRKAHCVSDESIEKEIPEIVGGAMLLLNGDFTYEKAMEMHLRKIKEGYDIKRFFGKKIYW